MEKGDSLKEVWKLKLSKYLFARSLVYFTILLPTLKIKLNDFSVKLSKNTYLDLFWCGIDMVVNLESYKCQMR